MTIFNKQRIFMENGEAVAYTTDNQELYRGRSMYDAIKVLYKHEEIEVKPTFTESNLAREIRLKEKAKLYKNGLWTPEMDIRLKELMQNFNMKEIAVKLGVKYSQVKWRCYQLKMPIRQEVKNGKEE